MSGLGDIRKGHQALKDRAIANLKATGKIREDEIAPNESLVLDELEYLVPFDEKSERRRRAKDVINALARDDDDEVGGLLVIMGVEYYFNPRRLIRFDGKIVENKDAPPIAKHADRDRSIEHRDRAIAKTAIKIRECELYDAWEAEQIAAGRPALEFTWENAVKETDVWRKPKPL